MAAMPENLLTHEPLERTVNNPPMTVLNPDNPSVNSELAPNEPKMEDIELITL
jgi:hypothetical protein